MLVLKSDIGRLACAKSLSPTEFIRTYCELNHALSEKAGRLIFQLRATDGKCVFLSEDNRCSIHGIKPLQCVLGPDRFLPDAMKNDYECMKDVVLVEETDQTEFFFSQLLEDCMPSGPIRNIGVAIDIEQQKQLTERFKTPDSMTLDPDDNDKENGDDDIERPNSSSRS